MPRSDYEQLLNLILPKSINGINISIENYRTAVTPVVFSKFLNTNINVYEKNRTTIGKLWIDIFPIDGFLEADEDLKKARYLNEKVWKHLTIPNKKYSLNRFIKPRGKFTKTLKQIETLYSQTSYSYSHYLCEYEWSNFFGGGRIPVFRNDLFDNMIELNFENLKLPAIASWDEYLTKRYGNYEKLPPESERWNHGVKAWFAH